MIQRFLPKQKILYQSDLFEPFNVERSPNSARVPVMKWFVKWLDGSDLKPEKICAIHGSARVSDEQIEKIRSLNNAK